LGNWVINFLLDKKNLVFDNKNTVEKKRILFLLLAGMTFLFLPEDILAINFLSNPGFEEFFLNWTPSSGLEEAVNFTISSYVKKSGDFSALIKHDKTSSYGAEQVIRDIVAGEKYTAKGYIFFNDENAKNARIRIAWYSSVDGTGSQIKTVDSNIIETFSSSWAELNTGVIEAPASAKSAKFRILLASVRNGAESLVYFDDLSFDITEVPTATPVLVPTLPLTPTSTATISPSPPHLTLGLTPTVIETATPMVIQSTPTPNPTPAKAVYQINEVKNEKGETLSSVKIYVDDQYIHHYAPEVLEFGNDYYCDDDKKVVCGFGEHTVRLEKSGYQDWEEIKTIRSGDSYFLNPVMVLPSSTPTSTLALTLTPTLKAEKEESLLPTITPFLLNQNSSHSPFLFLNSFSLLPKKLANKEEIVNDDFSQVLGEQEEREKESSDWYFLVGAFYLGTSGWRLYKKGDNDIMEKRDFKEEK